MGPSVLGIWFLFLVRRSRSLIGAGRKSTQSVPQGVTLIWIFRRTVPGWPLIKWTTDLREKSGPDLREISGSSISVEPLRLGSPPVRPRFGTTVRVGPLTGTRFFS